MLYCSNDCHKNKILSLLKAFIIIKCYCIIIVEVILIKAPL